MNHFDAQGRAIMVDVTDKSDTRRIAIAEGRIRMSPEALEAIGSGAAHKGDVLGVARVAGLMAVKRTPELIPLCHPLLTQSAAIEFELRADESAVRATCRVQLTGKTGAEMEALTGVSVALLTIYDMCKAIDRAMTIEGVRLLHKDGGKTGAYTADGGA